VVVGVGELVGVGVVVGLGVVVGVAEVVGVLVGVGVGVYCPAVGWLWAKLVEAAVGETVGELDLVGCADAGAEADGPCEGAVVPRRCPPCELTAPATTPPVDTPEGALEGLFTSRFNVTGVPAVVLPFGWDSRGLRVGIQLSAALGADMALLAAVSLIENAPACERREVIPRR
jgi:hypothetical protein